MKTFIIYHNDSHQKYGELYTSFTFEIDEKGILSIFKLSKTTGIPSLVACYKAWSYLTIDEDLE